MNEVRRTADSPQSKSVAKPARSKKHCRDRGALGGWRLDVRKCKLSNQGYLSQCRKEQGRSQSPHSSGEAGNDRGAKGGRKVEARLNRNASKTAASAFWLSNAEPQSVTVQNLPVGKPRKRKW
jgi:hypothetical protein